MKFIGKMLLAAALSMGAAPAVADYPEQPVKIIFPNKAGSGYHKIILALTALLEDKVPVPVVVQAMPGAGTAAGARFVQSQPADGYTMLFIHEASLQAGLMGMLGFDFSDEFEAIGRINSSSGGQYVRADAPYNTLAELQTYAQAHPGEVRASINTGALSHLDILKISDELDVELRLVHVSGGDSGSIQALLSGDIDVTKVNPVSMAGLVKSGAVKAIAYYGDERSAFLPDTPTVAEQGFTVPVTSNVHGYLWIRKSAPQEVKDYWGTVLSDLLGDPETEAELEDLLGVDFEFIGGDEVKAMVAEQVEVRRQLIEENGLGQN